MEQTGKKKKHREGGVTKKETQPRGRHGILISVVFWCYRKNSIEKKIVFLILHRIKLVMEAHAGGISLKGDDCHLHSKRLPAITSAVAVLCREYEIDLLPV